MAITKTTVWIKTRNLSSMRQVATPGCGSPVPTKRRRVASNKPARSLTRAFVTSDVKGTSERLEKTRSALDVLADQAAVFSSQDHDDASGNDKGKGKAKASDTGSPSMRSNETPMVGELGREKPHPSDQALQPQAVSHQSSSSSPTLVATVKALGHDPTSETSSAFEERASTHYRTITINLLSADSPQGTLDHGAQRRWTGRFVSQFPTDR